MNMKKLALGALCVLLTALPLSAFAQELDPSIAPTPVRDFVIDTNLHTITGLATLGVATATALMGPLDIDLHGVFGTATLGLSTTTLTLGSIAYRDQLPSIWPHVALNSLATVGFALNQFAWEYGSTEHIATGVVSMVSLYAGVIYIIAVTGGL